MNRGKKEGKHEIHSRKDEKSKGSFYLHERSCKYNSRKRGVGKANILIWNENLNSLGYLVK